MKPLCMAIIVLLLGCTSVSNTPRTVRTGPEPAVQVQPTLDYPVPTPSWPLRTGQAGPSALRPFLTSVTWILPEPPVLEPISIVPAKALSPPNLPLPEIRSLPVKATPASRSWTPVTEMKLADPPVPEMVTVSPKTKTPKVATVPSSSATKNVPTGTAKPPATVPATPQPIPKQAAPVPSTAAASANLLPAGSITASDFNWQDINAVAGDAVTLHFDKTNWLYLDSPAQQKSLGFLSISRDKDATTFQFRPKVPGQYVLEFQRQDLVNQTTDSRKVRMFVVPVGTRTSTSGTALSPQTSAVPPNDALEASRLLSSTGRTAEAVQKLLQSYKADDTRMNLELARLLDQTGQDDQALTYLDKNLDLTGPDFQGTLELGTKLAAMRDPEKKLPAYVRLWTAGTTAPPEDLYLQVFEALRKQNLSALTQDWSGRYGLWYPAPQLKDGYLFQLGQFLEEPGQTRNIQNAWKAYDELVQTYPLSPYWKSAGERASYLNRHFLQAR